MAAPSYVVNVHDASIGGVSLAKAARLTISDTAAQVLEPESDDEIRSQVSKVVSVRTTWSLETLDVATALGGDVYVGLSGTFTADVDPIGTGNEQTITISNALITGISTDSAHGSEGTVTYNGIASSSDGSSDPISIADKS